MLVTSRLPGWSWGVHGGVEFATNPESHDDLYPPGAEGRRWRETLDPGFTACFLRSSCVECPQDHRQLFVSQRRPLGLSRESS